LVSVERAASGSSGSVGAPEGAKAGRVRRRSLGTAFKRLWWATGISASGDGLLAVAVPLLAVTLTRNPVIIAGLTGANRASAALAALPGGIVADRWDRRTVMVICNLVGGVTLFALAGAMTAHWAELFVLYVVAVVLAACDVTYTLAVQACLPDVITSDRLAVANGRLIAVEGAGEQFIGPATGGILFSLARRVPFFVDSVSFFVAALLVRSGLPARSKREGELAQPPGTGDVSPNGSHPHAPRDNVLAKGSNGATVPSGAQNGARPQPPRRPRWVADLSQGIAIFRSERALQVLATMAAFGALCQTMIFGILVLYGQQTLHLSSAGYGFFLAFAAAIGVAAAHFSGHMQHRFGSAQLILGGFFLSIISYLGLAFTHSAVLAVFVFGLQEIGTVAANVGSVTARQRIIPRHLYGRVGSVHRLAVLSASVIGALAGGFIASATSVEATMLAAGVLLSVATVLIGPWLLRTLPGTLPSHRSDK
jgi:MFS family permease